MPSRQEGARIMALSIPIVPDRAMEKAAAPFHAAQLTAGAAAAWRSCGPLPAAAAGRVRQRKLPRGARGWRPERGPPLGGRAGDGDPGSRLEAAGDGEE